MLNLHTDFFLFNSISRELNFNKYEELHIESKNKIMFYEQRKSINLTYEKRFYFLCYKKINNLYNMFVNFGGCNYL